MDEPLKPVFPQQPEQIDPSSKQVQAVDKPQTLYLFVILICFFIALSSISFYVLYSKNRIHKDEMMIENTENETTVNTEGMQTITYNYWKFSIPTNWDYFSCKESNQIFAGESINDKFSSGFPIPLEKELDCGFDGNISEIYINRIVGLMSPNRTSVASPENPSEITVSQVHTLQIGGKQATVQFENIGGIGQGKGTYWKAYIPYGEGSDVIILSDISKKDVFDALLQSLSYTNYIPTPTQNPSNTPIPTSIPKQTYIDPDGFFTFTYPTTWKVRKTFGPSVAKTTPVQTEISGVDLQHEHDFAPSLVIVLNDMGGKSEDEINTDNKSSINATFNGRSAVKTTYQTSYGPMAETYTYTDGNYILFISFPLQSDTYNSEVQQIISSLKTFKL